MDRICLNRGWKFALHENGYELSHWDAVKDNQGRLIGEWETVDVPHDYSILQSRSPDSGSYRDGGYFRGGLGVYYRSFQVEESDRTKLHYIEFEGIYENAQVWLNGNVLGYHPYGYTGFFYRLDDYLQAGVNHLLVYVDNTAVPNSRWYSGSGIYRNVWLHVADSLHIAPWGTYVTTEVKGRDAEVIVETTLEGKPEGELQYRVYGPDGRIAAKKRIRILDSVMRTSLTIVNAALWKVDAPHLYTLKTEVLAKETDYGEFSPDRSRYDPDPVPSRLGEETVLDSQTTIFGIRTVTVDAVNGLRINGETIKLRGGCVHHDNGLLGARSYTRSEERKVALLKQNGYNAVRCAHNPPAPAFLEACDRLGLLVIDEAFDVWQKGKKRYDYHIRFEDWWRRDLESMLRRDRNHPSIIMWSIGNEIPEQKEESGYRTAKRLADAVRALDSSRLVNLAVDVVSPLTDPLFQSVDVAGYNYGYQHYEPDHARIPDRVMMGSESVAKYVYENWVLVEKHPYIIGDFVWTALDYLGEAGIGRVYYAQVTDDPKALTAYPWNKAHCGDIDLCGHKRPQSYYRDIVWGNRTIPYIAVRKPTQVGGVSERMTYWGWYDHTQLWNFPGKTVLVDVYAKGERVELFLNGRSLGVKPLQRAPTPEELRGEHSEDCLVRAKYAALYEVPFEPGELTAVTEYGQYSIRTAGAAYTIRLEPDSYTFAGDGDLCYVDVLITDNTGCLNWDAENMVEFSVEGCGRIIALGSSNPADEEMYVGHRHTAYGGRLTVVIQSEGGGAITLKASADGLDSAAVTLLPEGR